MPEQMTSAELFGTTTKTSAELFGVDVVDDSKFKPDIPDGDRLIGKRTSYRDRYKDILTGTQSPDSILKDKDRPTMRATDPNYDDNAKKMVNSMYLADQLGIDVDDAYTTHDQLVSEMLDAKTPTDAFGRISDRFTNGQTQVEIMDLGYSILTGKGDEELTLAQIQKLQSQLSLDGRADLRGFCEQIVGATAEQLPNMWEAMKASPKGAIPGGIIGGLVAAGAGQLLPVPEEAVTVPAGIWKGVKWGGGIAAANRIRQMEAGGMYLELLELEDENGNKIDPNIAKATAHAVGAINGGIELAEWGILLSTFGIGTKVFEKSAAKVTSKLFAAGTLKHVAMKYALKYGGAMTAEIGQEVWQESNNIVFGELAKEINNRAKGTDIKHVTGAELASRYYEITTESAKGFALLIAPGTIISGTKEAVGVKKAVKAPVKPTEKPAGLTEITPAPAKQPKLVPISPPDGTKPVSPKVAGVEAEVAEKAVEAVYETPEVDEITEQVEDLTKQETADLAQLDALPDEKAEKPSKRKPTVKIREFLTPGSTVDKVVKEYTALKAAMKKAATAARTAFSSGKKEGIAKIKEHYKALKAAEKTRKALKKRIEKAVKVIKKAPPKTVDFFYRQAIEAIQSSIDPANRTKKTKQKRQRMREFLATATSQQKKDFPKKLATLLDKKDLGQFTVEELESVAAEIKNLTKLGKTKRTAKVNIEKAQHEKNVNNLTETAGGVPAVPDAPKGIDFSRDGIKQAIKNGYLWTLRIPRIMDWLDGRTGKFGGFWHRMFYDSVNQQTNDEMRVSEQRHKAGTDKMVELEITANDLAEVDDFTSLQAGLSLTKEQQMGIWAALKNGLSLDALVNGNKIKEVVAKAIAADLDVKYKQLAEFIIAEYDSNYGRLRETYIEQTNDDLGKEAFYTPIIRLELNETASNQEVVDQLLERHNLKRGYVQKKFTIDRKNIAPEHQKPMDLRLVSIWQSQVQKQEHFIHFTPLIKQLRKILADKKIKAVVDEKLGSQGMKIIDNYVSRVANPSIYKAYDGMAGISRTLRRNVAMAYLSYNLMTMTKQLPSLILYAKDAGPAALLSSISEFAQNPREMLDMVREKFPQIKDAAIERELADLREIAKRTGDKDTLAKIEKLIAVVGDKGMIGIQTLDRVVKTIGFNAVYQKNMQLGLGEAESVRAAQNATLRTQPASAPKDIAQLYATDEYINWFTMFTNQLNNIWNITTYDTYAYYKSEKYQDAAMTLMAVSTNAAIIWMLANKRLPEDEDDLLDMATDQVLNMLPLINSGAMAGKRGWGVTAPPPFVAVADVAKIYSAEDKEKQALRALQSTLVLTGVPVVAIKRGVKFAETGEPGELLGGQKKKKGIKL